MIALIQRYLLLALGTVAVCLLIACLFLRNSANRANVRADAATARAQAAEATLRQVTFAETTNAEATAMARSGADTRKAINAVSTARVRGYADSVADGCTASPDILRELQAKADDIRTAQGRLRDLRRPDK